ncbi:replicative DNA helicase [Lacticaseibacillus rhamnosus]|uniref:Replicative DNA helicase n=1 Tax=Lacticaseibacillus rhamnosus TaxID=47715 RepID=A0A7Y7UIZ8_LACRH|nr:replicative DNA helicase [Lacticaseibacillus rhamnosus]OFN08018.1 replicative DNA helicase [Lactobacillus sp. HMSC072E07]MDK7182050.1 replicative DNA helicase [Lacticaseibacillus rhamnosus]MDK7239902.1 replicative DNA helicase [Lacticaseibacillus rhamnosus]MDT8863740.1 replicative DNA helicase [Lacticaseibacillus rhamnosus]NVO87908.1 replicative DNA helicase [Lacticaseibacillus rhamnosus]
MDNQLIEQQPPHSDEAERAVLGGIFLNADTLPDAQEYVTADDFYKKSHRLLFQAMTDLQDNGTAIDTVTVTDYLDNHNQLDDIGGAGYITDLVASTPIASNVVYYAKIVQQKSTLRKLISTAQSIASRSYTEQDDVEGLVEDAERQIMDVSENRNQAGFKQIKDVLNQAMAQIDQLYQNDQTITGLPTGFRDLDKITTGLHEDEMIILAARPAVGKTAFALNIAQNVGTKTDKSVAIFSLEMGAEQLVNRMLCSEGSIDANHLRTGQLNEEEWQNLIIAMGSLSKAKIYMDDTPGIRMAEIRAKCRRLAREQGDLGLIIIDYLQLIEGSGQENRQQEVSAVSRQLKKLAKELHVPVIALSQLSRGVEQRQDKRPVLSDIRESGSIEQDADIVAFLYRDDYYRDAEGDEDEDQDSGDDGDDNVGEVEVIIEKNRSGPRGTVKLLFVKSYNKFTNIAYNGPDQ